MHTLQNVDLDASPEVELLYFRYESQDPSLHVKHTPDGLEIPAGLAVWFDSYFNAFFENYWDEHTSVDDLRLQLRAKGKLVVTVLRRSPERDTAVVVRETFNHDTMQTAEIVVPAADAGRFPTDPGRLFFRIETAEDTVVESGAWVTSNDPVRDVSLSMIICTFNRQPYLREVLASLAASESARERVSRLFVINQGDDFTLEELAGPETAALLGDRVTIISQNNMGGCGGFSRGLYETAQDHSLTHFLLLDDDIQLHPDSLVRTTSFLGHASADTAVGGHMLNLHRPNFIYEAGSVLDPDTMAPVALAHNVFAGNDGGLDHFLVEEEADYNAWWFFAGPTSVLDKNLPMPCFIRGDDIEFGVRLKELGTRTVPVPGIAVWHEPFYKKVGTWHHYFDILNRLLLVTTHETGDFDKVKRQIKEWFTNDISTNRYHLASYLVMVLEDYTAGPDVCFATDDSRLKRCLSVLNEVGPTKVEETYGTLVPDTGAHYDGKPFEGRQRVKRMARGLLQAPSEGETPIFRPHQFHPGRMAQLDRYCIRENFGNGQWLYERRPDVERDLWQRFTKVYARFQPNPAIAAHASDDEGWQNWWADAYQEASPQTSH